MFGWPLVLEGKRKECDVDDVLHQQFGGALSTTQGTVGQLERGHRGVPLNFTRLEGRSISSVCDQNLVPTSPVRVFKLLCLQLL